MQASKRLKKLVASEVDCCSVDEIDQCREANLDDRLNSLRELQDAVGRDVVDTDIHALSRLGDETRYTIVRLLVAAEKDLCVCELEPLLDVSESALSHALSDLRNAGLVTRERRGKWRFYQPTDRAEALIDAIDTTSTDI